MPSIGIVGGMSWHSTALYYDLLNRLSEQRYGNHANVESILVTLSFAPLVAAMGEGDLGEIERQILTAAAQVNKAGASCVLLTAFTAHFCAPAVGAAISLPFVDAGDALAKDCLAKGITKLGLLGTAFTLGSGHVARRLEAHGVKVMLPPGDTVTSLNVCIQNDLTAGRVTEQAQEVFDTAVSELARDGAEAVALACTELPLLLPRPAPVPLINGVEAHVRSALDKLETIE